MLQAVMGLLPASLTLLLPTDDGDANDDDDDDDAINPVIVSDSRALQET